MKTVVVLLLCVLAMGCESYPDTPTASDLRLVINPDGLKTKKPIDKKAIACRVSAEGLRSVTCQYDWEKSAYAKDTDAILFYNSGFTRYATANEAEGGYRGTRDGYAKGIGSMRWFPADELIDLGDQHHASYLVHEDGTRAGNAFIIRKGSTVLRLIVSGAVIEDPKVARALLEPLINETKK
jgi:hypothetical protein